MNAPRSLRRTRLPLLLRQRVRPRWRAPCPREDTASRRLPSSRPRTRGAAQACGDRSSSGAAPSPRDWSNREGARTSPWRSPPGPRAWPGRGCASAALCRDCGSARPRGSLGGSGRDPAFGGRQPTKCWIQGFGMISGPLPARAWPTSESGLDDTTFRIGRSPSPVAKAREQAPMLTRPTPAPRSCQSVLQLHPEHGQWASREFDATTCIAPTSIPIANIIRSHQGLPSATRSNTNAAEDSSPFPGSGSAVRVSKGANGAAKKYQLLIPSSITRARLMV